MLLIMIALLGHTKYGCLTIIVSLNTYKREVDEKEIERFEKTQS